MSLEQFVPVQPADGKAGPSTREFVELGTRLVRTLGRLLKIPLLDGVLIENLSATASVESAIGHGLGRKYRGFIVVRNSAGAVFNELFSSTDTATFLRITPDKNVSFALWVF